MVFPTPQPSSRIVSGGLMAVISENSLSVSMVHNVSKPKDPMSVLEKVCLVGLVKLIPKVISLAFITVLWCKQETVVHACQVFCH